MSIIPEDTADCLWQSAVAVYAAINRNKMPAQGSPGRAVGRNQGTDAVLLKKKPFDIIRTRGYSWYCNNKTIREEAL